MCCYKTLENRETPCPSCPLIKLADRQNYTGLLQRNDQPGKILMEATRIRWDGEPACLISGIKIPE